MTSDECLITNESEDRAHGTHGFALGDSQPCMETGGSEEEG